MFLMSSYKESNENPLNSLDSLKPSPPPPPESTELTTTEPPSSTTTTSVSSETGNPSLSPNPSQNRIHIVYHRITLFPLWGRKKIKDPQIPITWPSGGTLTLDWVTNLMSTFDWSSRNLQPSELSTLLPVEAFDGLILTPSKILHKEPNCVPIEPDKDAVGASVVVVGDVHRQLHDVLFLLKDSGFPCENRFYVFNGDYVDRGAWGLETFLLLLAWKVFMPHRVFLLRRNHESKYCTSVYGFENEVLAKYGDNNKGKHVYRECLGCFKGLPLASIIAGPAPSKWAKGKKNRKVILSADSVPLSLGSLEELSEARRTVLNPPWEGPNLIPGDVLWSDPSMKPGLSPNDERGIGLLWGPDCTEDFLKKSGLKVML
ncbi:putative protein-serine/threonine phosphatase [Helianthus annuus]|nr:putative protein-serine/threonine phosphatase [Helianthus annuus]